MAVADGETRLLVLYGPWFRTQTPHQRGIAARVAKGYSPQHTRLKRSAHSKVETRSSSSVNGTPSELAAIANDLFRHKQPALIRTCRAPSRRLVKEWAYI